MVCAMVCACMCDGMCMCVVCAWRAWYMHASPLQGWSWHDCHQHWHYDNYAHYALRKLCTNEDVAWEDRPVVGHKNGWCVSDVDTYGPTGGGGRCNHPSPYLPLGLHEFTCMNMGISSGCSDLYKSDYACQWIDITDITDGYYWLTVSW